MVNPRTVVTPVSQTRKRPLVHQRWRCPGGRWLGRWRTIVGVRTTNSNLPVCREPIALRLVKGSSGSKVTVDMVTQNTSA